MDSLITVGCLSPQGVQVRLRESHDAIAVLSFCPRLVTYLDAGAADAVPAGRVASLLRRAGVARIQCFFLNSTHFDWTSREIPFGERVSRLTGGRHFVVSTGENGQGPLVPADRVHHGNEVLCNPPGRGLGAQAHRGDRLSQRGRVRVDQQPRRTRRVVRPGRAADRRLLADVRGRAGRARGLRGSLARPTPTAGTPRRSRGRPGSGNAPGRGSCWGADCWVRPRTAGRS